MGATNNDGPNFTYGSLGAIPLGGVQQLNDPNTDAGPNGEFQGSGFLDPRYFFPKDQVTGFCGRVPMHFDQPYVRSASGVPSALSASNLFSGTITSGTPVTFAAATTGVSAAIPIIPQSVAINGATPVTVQVLDFGFEFGTTTAGSAVITVASAFDFEVGMPLIIEKAGNVGGTVPLASYVLSINTSTPSITIATPSLYSGTCAIGTGNIWAPNPAAYLTAGLVPTAHLPWIGEGPGLILDGRQALARGLQCVAASGSTATTFTVKGYDIYWQPMTWSFTTSGGTQTIYSTKAFKAVASITPSSTTDTTHTYTFGTSDLFGFHYFVNAWEDTDVSWGGTFSSTNSGTSAAVVMGVLTTPSGSTGDVRGTVQLSASGPSGSNYIQSTGATNGSVSSLVMTGRRLTIMQVLGAWQASQGNAGLGNSVIVFGQTQF